jgi:hypothetical protein
MTCFSDLTKKEYTDGKFLEMLEKRVRKHLRIEKTIDSKKNYVLIDDDSATVKLLAHFLDAIFSKRLSFRLIKNENELNDSEIVLFSQHLEEYISKRLEVFFNAGDLTQLSKINAPLRMVSAKEINQAVKILGLCGLEAKSSNYFIEQLQEKYPQTKNSFLKSFDNVKDIINF